MDYLINKKTFDNKIEKLLPNYDKLDFLVTKIKGDTIIRDCTKILLNDKIRIDYVGNKLITL